MSNLWERWWFRALIGLLATPFAMGAGCYPILLALALPAEGYINWWAALTALPALSLIEIGLAVLPWIVMEVGNRQRRRPLPPGLTAAWLALSSAYLTALILLMMQCGRWFPEIHLDALMEGVGTGLPISLAVYVAPFVLAWFTVRPFIVRWAATAGEVDRAGIF